MSRYLLSFLPSLKIAHLLCSFSLFPPLNLLTRLLKYSRKASTRADLKKIYESFQKVLTFISKGVSYMWAEREAQEREK
jgi:hypothetical protein